MSSLFSEFASWGDESIEGKEAVQIAQKIWDISEQEGYWSERGRLAADVVHVAASHSE